jgi:hypothetical protein
VPDLRKLGQGRFEGGDGAGVTAFQGDLHEGLESHPDRGRVHQGAVAALLIFGELLCWGVFGIHEADPRLVVLGATGVVASLLVLARVSWLRADRAPVTHLVKAP